MTALVKLLTQHRQLAADGRNQSFDISHGSIPVYTCERAIIGSVVRQRQWKGRKGFGGSAGACKQRKRRH